jgi:hypothetical protein
LRSAWEILCRFLQIMGFRQFGGFFRHFF